jgi:hypothetical protein
VPDSLATDQFVIKSLAFYSYRKASTGFLVAALQLCQLIVRKAMLSAIIPAKENTHQLNSV